MSVPTCRGCAHHIKSWTGREYDKCAISPGFGYANSARSYGRCGVEARFWTAKKSILELIGLKASQTRPDDTREASKRVSARATEHNPPDTTRQGEEG